MIEDGGPRILLLTCHSATTVNYYNGFEIFFFFEGGELGGGGGGRSMSLYFASNRFGVGGGRSMLLYFSSKSMSGPYMYVSMHEKGNVILEF